MGKKNRRRRRKYNSTKPSVAECEHWYQPEFKESTIIKHYSHPPYYSEKLGRECTGGGFHSESYSQGYCATCHAEIQIRNCSMFYVMGEACVKNEVLGPYEKVETGRYPMAYLKSCDCGNNTLLADGLVIIKETCKYCGDVKNYPQK